MGYKRSAYNHWKPEGFIPRCKDTKCIGRIYRKYHTEQAAVEAWNRRSTDEELQFMQQIIVGKEMTYKLLNALEARSDNG